jgi:hypothetical protein
MVAPPLQFDFEFMDFVGNICLLGVLWFGALNYAQEMGNRTWPCREARYDPGIHEIPVGFCLAPCTAALEHDDVDVMGEAFF